MTAAPAITVLVRTRNRAGMLAEALDALLAEPGDGFEVLVVDDGSTDATPALLAERAGARLRVVRHEEARGHGGALNAGFAAARGAYVAILDDDDRPLPGWPARLAAAIAAADGPDAVMGRLRVVDADGRPLEPWPTPDIPEPDLLRTIVRVANVLPFPGSAFRVETVRRLGGFREDLPIAEDYHLWLRLLAAGGRVAHAGPEPLIDLRRHGANTTAASARARELACLETVLRDVLPGLPLDVLVPEVDRAVLAPAAADAAARRRLADDLARRGLDGLAAELRAAAERDLAAAPRPARRGRVLFTMFGWNDPGGGTVLPRLLAKELATRGWDVTVFHAAVAPLPGAGPYAVREHVDDGVRVVGVHNRPSPMLDLGHPHREVDDPAIAAAFARVLDETRPDVIHWHNLHNLGASLVDEAFARGIRSVLTTHNLWLACPRNHLVRGDGTLCDGPADHGRACAACVGVRDADGYARRREEVRERVGGKVDRILAVSEAVRRLLLGAGFPEGQVDVLRQAMPGTDAIWDALGAGRAPGRVGEGLVVGFIGSCYAHKGPQLLVEAAQLVPGVRVRIHGDVPPDLAEHMRRLDARGVVELAGPYRHADLPAILGALDAVAIPSTIWDAAPLAVAEALAGRVPVIASRMGGVAEGVRDGIDGLVVEGRSVAGLAGALRRLADEDGLLERLQAGIAPPRRWAAYVDDVEAAYAAPGPLAPRADVPVTVRWRGDQAAVSSLAAINRAVTARLAAEPGLLVARSAPDLAADPPLPYPPEVEVRHAWPHDLTAPGAGRLAVILPWEFGSVPRTWVEAMDDAVDEAWVPSAYVRGMLIADGADPARVHVVPNGVDLDVYRPDGPRRDGLPEGRRLLFVGGTIQRKGIDLLLEAYRSAIGPDDGLVLVIKDVGSTTFYRGRNARAEIDALAATPGAPIVVLDDDLDDEALASLYRSCDVLVHPYRGEGFAMPVLEAMACGLPVAVTAGGPTDEFVPAAARWPIAATRRPLERGLEIETVAQPWMLEPDPGALRAALVAIRDAPAEELAARGAAARAGALAYGWDAIAAGYAERIRTLAARPPRAAVARGAAFALPEPRGLNLLATPAWRGEDGLPALLAAWAAAFREGDDVALYLLADPTTDGDAARWEERVLDAAERAGAPLDDVADIQVLDHAASADDLRRLVAAVDGLVPLHPACGGLVRHAGAAGVTVLAPTADALRAWAAAGRAHAA